MHRFQTTSKYYIFPFQVQGEALYKPGTFWTADNNIGDARQATEDAGLTGVSTMSWFCNWGGGGVAGIAYLGTLCGRYNTNLNEASSNKAVSGFVSIFVLL